jgi:hypothetical protein
MNTVLNPTTIDARLAQLRDLFGAPPVLSSENLKAYYEMLRRFIECFEPQDFFETVLMKDIADGTWESARYSRHKVLLLDRRYRGRREAEANRRKESAQNKAELARRIAASKGEPATEPMEAGRPPRCGMRRHLGRAGDGARSQPPPRSHPRLHREIGQGAAHCSGQAQQGSRPARVVPGRSRPANAHRLG